MLAGGCGRNKLVVETEPPGATVWAGAELLGAAPQRVTVPSKGELKLRVSHPSYQDHVAVLTAAKLPKDKRLKVRLQPKQSVAILCVSHPPAADLFVAGEYRGKTPLKVTDVKTGGVQLTFRMKDRVQVTRTVEVGGGEQQQVVEVRLESVTAGYYRQQIRKRPREIANYVDLAHHLMLEKDFRGAMGVFEAGLRVALAGSDGETHRLWSEVQRVLDKQYDYGTDEDVKRAQRMVKALLEKLFKAHSRESPELYVHYILALDAVGERDRAQEMFEAAWVRFPTYKQLKHLQRRKRFRKP